MSTPLWAEKAKAVILLTCFPLEEVWQLIFLNAETQSTGTRRGENASQAHFIQKSCILWLPSPSNKQPKELRGWLISSVPAHLLSTSSVPKFSGKLRFTKCSFPAPIFSFKWYQPTVFKESLPLSLSIDFFSCLLLPCFVRFAGSLQLQVAQCSAPAIPSLVPCCSILPSVFHQFSPDNRKICSWTLGTIIPVMQVFYSIYLSGGSCTPGCSGMCL